MVEQTSSVYKYDRTYPYFLDSLKNTGNLGHDLRVALRDYFRVWLPLRLKPGAKLLDIGSNIGTLGHFLKYLGVCTTGIDLNRDAVRAGRNIYGNEQGNRSIVADGRSLPFRRNCFDAIVSRDVFEHLPDEKGAAQMLKEMGRVLKPDKDKMFHKITVLEDLEYIHADPSHRLKWSTSEWVSFFECRGWRVIDNPTRHFPIAGNISYGNFLLKRKDGN